MFLHQIQFVAGHLFDHFTVLSALNVKLRSNFELKRPLDKVFYLLYY